MFGTLKEKGVDEPLGSLGPFNDWEMESVECFLLKLHAKRVHRDVEDKVI